MVHVEGFHAKSKYYRDFGYKVAVELRYLIHSPKTHCMTKLWNSLTLSMN